MDNTPSEYIGIEAPSNDPDQSARELFGLETTSVLTNHQPQQQGSGSGGSDGPLLQLYTPFSPYYGPLYGYTVPVAHSSQTPLVGIPPPAPFIHQYMPHPYLPYDMTGVYCGAPMTAANPNMMFGMGYVYPVCSEEVEVYEDNSNDDEDTTNSSTSINHVSTPTSHYIGRNRQCHAQKRLYLSDEENTDYTAAQLAESEGQEMDVDVIVQELIKRSKEDEVNKDNGAAQSESSVIVHGLSNDEKDQLEQMTSFGFQNLLRTNFHSLGTYPSSASDENIDNNTLARSPSIHRIQSLLELNNHSIEVMQSGLRHGYHQEGMEVSEAGPPSPVSAEVTVETYQG